MGSVATRAAAGRHVGTMSSVNGYDMAERLPPADLHVSNDSWKREVAHATEVDRATERRGSLTLGETVEVARDCIHSMADWAGAVRWSTRLIKL